MNFEQRRTLINLIDAQANVVISQLGDNYTEEEYQAFLSEYLVSQTEFLDALADGETSQLELDL
ncbi:hypothetical protein D3C81_1284170 [compost metagenome]